MPFVPLAVSRSRWDQFGQRHALFRGAPAGRRLPVVAMVAALPVAGLSILLGFTTAPAAALAPPLALLVVLVILAAGRAQWLAVYRRGVVFTDGSLTRSAHWPDVSGVTGNGRSLTVQLSGTAVKVHGLSRRAQKAALDLLSAEVAFDAFDRAKTALAVSGQAGFPPLTITREGLFLSRDGSTEQAPWNRVVSVEQADGQLTLVITTAEGRTERWFEGPVANATAATQLIEETNPPTAARGLIALLNPLTAAETGVAAELRTAREEVRHHERVGRRAAAGVAALVALGVLVPVIASALAPPPPSLADVCSGQADPDAAPYTPTGSPASVYFVSVGGFDSAASNGNGYDGADYVYARDGQLITSDNYEEPSSWGFTDPAKVQLVACVKTAGNETGSPVYSCSYGNSDQGDGAVVPVSVDTQAYAISLYAAATGKLLTSKTVDGSDQNVCPNSIEADEISPYYPPLPTILSADDINSVIGQYAGT